MKSADNQDLSTQYHQLLIDYPIQHAVLCDDQAWSWIDTGAGSPTLLMLPGLLGEAETSFLFIRSLAADLRVISVSYPPSVGQVRPFCDGLCALLDRLHLQQVTILGGSSGGYLAQAFARRYPERASGLILTHTGLPSPSGARTNRLYLNLLRFIPFRLLRQIMHVGVYSFFPHRTAAHAFWRSHFQYVILRQSQSSLMNRMALIEDFHRKSHFQPGDFSAGPEKILLMEMRADRTTTVDEKNAMRALYPTARLHVFSDAAHFDAVEQPEEQIRVIKEFMLSQ